MRYAPYALRYTSSVLWRRGARMLPCDGGGSRGLRSRRLDGGDVLVERPTLIKPGLFSVEAMADGRRGVFDYHNEALLARGVPIDAVFIGDSITDMWALDAFFRGTAGGFIVNRGIGGDRTPFVRRRFSADVIQLRPRLVVIKIGVNNTWDLDEWEPSMRRSPEEIEEEIVSDITAMVTAARVEEM